MKLIHTQREMFSTDLSLWITSAILRLFAAFSLIHSPYYYY